MGDNTHSIVGIWQIAFLVQLRLCILILVCGAFRLVPAAALHRHCSRRLPLLAPLVLARQRPQQL